MIIGVVAPPRAALSAPALARWGSGLRFVVLYSDYYSEIIVFGRYFVSLVLLGIPLMLLELGLGQYRQKSFVVCMQEIHHGFAGLAWASPRKVLCKFPSAGSDSSLA